MADDASLRLRGRLGDGGPRVFPERPLEQLVRVLADEHGPGVAGDVVPPDAVAVAVVEDVEARLVVPLLQVLHSEAAVVLHVAEGAGLVALVVVGLRPLQLAGLRPDSDRVVDDAIELLIDRNSQVVKWRWMSHQKVFGDALFVGGILELPAPAQNHPFTLIG